MKKSFRRLTVETDAQDLIEYALLSAAISIVAFALLGGIGVDVRGTYDKVSVGVSAANATGGENPGNPGNNGNGNGNNGNNGNGNNGNGNNGNNGNGNNGNGNNGNGSGNGNGRGNGQNLSAGPELTTP